jgi:hypothetical protein
MSTLPWTPRPNRKERTKRWSQKAIKSTMSFIHRLTCRIYRVRHLPCRHGEVCLDFVDCREGLLLYVSIGCHISRSDVALGAVAQVFEC